MSFSSILIKEGDYHSRIHQIKINNKVLNLPTYFPSISSFGTKFHQLYLLNFLKTHKIFNFLISAYDIYNDGKYISKIIEIINEIRKTTIIFLDSGLFESFWKSDYKWNFNSYKQVLEKTQIDFFSSFDEIVIKTLKEDSKYNTLKLDFEIYEGIQRNSKCIPIIHGSTPLNLTNNIKTLFKRKNFDIIAISERDLGFSIIEKIKTVIKIKNCLKILEKNPIIHLLGCGHPTSIIIFVLLGIDSFDSLDWLKYITDFNQYILQNFDFLPFLNCNCDVCQIEDLEYIEKVFLHNLVFYETLFNSIEKSIFQGNLLYLLKSKINPQNFQKIKNIID